MITVIAHGAEAIVTHVWSITKLREYCFDLNQGSTHKS